MWSPGNKSELKLNKLKKFVRNYFISKTDKNTRHSEALRLIVPFSLAGCVLHVRRDDVTT